MVAITISRKFYPGKIAARMSSLPGNWRTRLSCYNRGIIFSCILYMLLELVFFLDPKFFCIFICFLFIY